MSCYIISFELSQDNRVKKLEALLGGIKSYKGWARITYSTWAVVTDDKARDIRENLSKYITDSDRLFVLKSGVEAAWKNSRCKNEWLKKNL